jgi:hypothetical protein
VRKTRAGSQLEEMMNKSIGFAVAAALVLGVGVSATSSFAQNGPAGGYFGAGSGPQSGGSAAAMQPATPPHTTRNLPGADAQASGGPAGPAAMNYGAGSGPQSGNKPFVATTSGKSASITAQTPGAAGPAGNNYGAGSSPQSGK